MKKATIALGVFAVAGLAISAQTSARDRGYDSARGTGYVVAESRWGHGTVRGPVRPGRNGYQVRLPGGTWVDCVRDNCSETLRLQTVDVFETMGVSPLDGGPGYFRRERRF